MGPLAIAGAGAAFNFITSYIQQQKANKALEELSKNKPSGFEITPEQQASYDRAQLMARAGYTQAEKSAFMGNLASQSNQQYSRAMTMGGNTLAGAISAGINYGNTQALNTFAANDAALQRRNIQYADQRGDVITQQRNLNTRQQLGEYMDKQRAYGQAKSLATAGMTNAVNSFINSAILTSRIPAPQGGGTLAPVAPLAEQMPNISEMPEYTSVAESAGFSPMANFGANQVGADYKYSFGQAGKLYGGQGTNYNNVFFSLRRPR